jgi:heparan-alpha-glucosaminide N-acetyltransferase
MLGQTASVPGRNPAMSQTSDLTPDPAARLVSLDAYRGFVMVCLAANGFGIAATAKNFPDSGLWQMLRYQFDHVPWTGCAFWDLIQPSFMFMVGVSLPYSYAKRHASGESYFRMLGHAIIRSIVLVLLGIFLSSGGKPMTDFTFMNVLTQIGLGYSMLFLLWNRHRALQAAVAVLILIGYWSWFAWTPVESFDVARLKLPADFVPLSGLPLTGRRSLTRREHSTSGS